MGFINSYGQPWGLIPNNMGRVFWVAPSDSYTVEGYTCVASDGNDGLAPERAFRTINYAWSKVAANVGDTIVLLPGTHSPVGLTGSSTNKILANVEGVTMTGLPYGSGGAHKYRVTVGPVAGDEIMYVSAAGIEISYINFVPESGQGCIDFTGDATRLNIHHCYFDMNTPAASVNTRGITCLGAAERVRVAECLFDCDAAQGNAITLTGADAALVEDCRFLSTAGTWASVIICGAATVAAMIRECDFLAFGTAITVGVNGTGADQANGVSVFDCRFSSLVTKGIDNFDAAECEISENYDAGVGATDGGVLITAIT